MLALTGSEVRPQMPDEREVMAALQPELMGYRQGNQP